jgi:hypothetical protein
MKGWTDGNGGNGERDEWSEEISDDGAFGDIEL